MRIAMVSEHASPLACLAETADPARSSTDQAAAAGIGAVDAGGQNVHVHALATALGRAGHEVVVHTRRTDAATPQRVPLAPGVVVDHVPAGPAVELGKDDLLEHMGEFADVLRRQWTARPPDVAHAHFWMSGLAALDAGRATGVPVTQTFHALGSVKRRHQGARDTSPAERVARESDLAASVDRVIATCHDEVAELVALGVSADRIDVVPCGVDVDHFTPSRRPSGHAVPRILTVSRLVPRKGVDTVVRALGRLAGLSGRLPELVVAGGPTATTLDDDAEVARLRAIAAAEGVADRVHFVGRVAPAADARPDALRRRRRLPARLRALRPGPARGDGLRAAGRGRAGRRARRHRGRRPHRAARPARRRGRRRPGPRGAARRPGPRRAAGPRRPGPGRGALRLGPHRRRDRGGLPRRARRPRRTRRARRRPDGGALVSPTAQDTTAAPRRSADAVVDDHLDGLGVTLAALRAQAPRLTEWGTELAARLRRGQRLLAAGNGGSAAEAQHLTAELVGRYRGEREPLSAIALHADTSTITALGNDYGFVEIYARQVRAHGRPGDVLVLLSTSGRSDNLLAAAEVARSLGVTVWSVTGAEPNPLAAASDEAVCLPGATPSVQEAHLVAVHLLCEMVDAALGRSVVQDGGGAR